VVSRVRVVPVRRRDTDVAADVGRALRGTVALARLPLQASVRDGVVELRGTITSWDEQQLAERVVTGVPGVRFCQNQLSARPPLARTDAIVAGDVRSRLDFDPLVEHDSLEVDVHHGRVSLSGKVGSQAEARRAASSAWVKGVIAVDTDRLVTDVSSRPDVYVRASWPDDNEISAVISELAQYWPSVPIASLSINVLDGTVTLRGSVPTLSDSVAAQRMAMGAVGVVRIDNQLRGPWRKEPASTPPPPRPRGPRR
jgi:osmotically-inducible protein OsmY